MAATAESSLSWAVYASGGVGRSRRSSSSPRRSLSRVKGTQKISRTVDDAGAFLAGAVASSQSNGPAGGCWRLGPLFAGEDLRLESTRASGAHLIKLIRGGSESAVDEAGTFQSGNKDIQFDLKKHQNI